MYEMPKLVVFVFSDEDIVRTSPASSEKNWYDSNVDDGSWTKNY